MMETVEQRKQRMIDKEGVSQRQPTEETSGTIIANDPLKLLIESVSKVDLIHTLQVKIEDPLVKYKNEDGDIDAYKVPQNLYIVAIIYEIMETAKRIDLGIAVRHGVIYIYGGRYWKEIEDEDIKRVLSGISKKLGFYSPAVADTFEFKKKLFAQFIDTGIDEAPARGRRKKILINLKNGTLEIDKHNVKLRPHHRDDFLTYSLDYNYNPDATAPIFTKYLDDVLPEIATQNVLQEFMGYVFTQNFKVEKVAVLHGDGQNGKSVFFEVVNEMMGKDNISYKGLGDICMRGDKGNNHRADLENKLINYASELNPEGADFDIFKALTSAEPTSARRLYKDVYMFSNTAKMIFNANKLPSSVERTKGFFRRFLIIPFDVTITEDKKDINLHNKIIDGELSGVLNWTIIGLKRLLNNEDFSYAEKVEKAVEKYKKSTNSVALFIEDEGFIKDLNGTYTNKMLYSAYSEWCNDSGMRRLNKANFGREMAGLGFETYRTGRERGFRIIKRA